jgi:hypothetical protein
MNIPQSCIEPFGALPNLRKMSMALARERVRAEMSNLAGIQPMQHIPWGQGFTLKVRYENEDT